MKALCIIVALVAVLTGCKDADFNDCAEVGGDRGGSGLIPKCGGLASSFDGGGTPTQGPPPWDPDDAGQPSQDAGDAAVDAGAVQCHTTADCAGAPPGFG